MKSKKIVALALVAAMSISMASMTAFADEAVTWLSLKKTITTDIDTSSTEEVYAIQFKQEGKDFQYHIFLHSDLDSTTDLGDGKVKHVKTISTTLAANKGPNEAELTFGQIKSKLSAPGNNVDEDAKFVGWSNTDSTHNTAAKAYALSDTVTVAKDGDAVKDGDIYYPVYQKKTTQDLLNDAAEKAARPKVAKTADDKDWTYTVEELTTKVSKEKGVDDGAAEDCEKCNTTMSKSRVFDVKPIVAETGKDVELRKSQSPKVDVKLPVAGLPDPSTGALTSKDNINKAIKEGKLKVFHIGSDGKSHPVSGISAAEEEGTFYVTFKFGSFSDFVITTDDKAKAQAGEEESASGGNPATGEASALPVAMLALAALSATGVVAYKKRKAE